MITENDFFKKQEQFKTWFLNEKKNCNTMEKHVVEFKYFLSNIIYASHNLSNNIWTLIKYQEHMISIAEQVELSSEDIDYMRQQLDYNKQIQEEISR